MSVNQGQHASRQTQRETFVLFAGVAIQFCIMYTIFTFVEFVFDRIPYGELIAKMGFTLLLVSEMLSSHPIFEQLNLPETLTN